MDDAVLVRGLEGFGDLPGDRQRLVQRNGSLRDAIRERRSLDELEDERAFLESVNRRDVQMIERREDLRLALEARQAIGIECERLGQDFQRDVAIEPAVARAIPLAHPARADEGSDFVRADARPDGQGHETVTELPEL